MTEARKRCAAIVLAAGASSRLGQSKQLFSVEGEPLVRRTVRLAASAGCTPVFVVTAKDASAIHTALEGAAVETVENPQAETGMGSSLAAGAAALLKTIPSPERVLVLVCDQPLLREDHLQTLLAAEAPSGIAAAFYSGRLGVPAVFSQKHFPALAASTGNQGARALLREHAHEITAVPMPEAALDLDTPDDLRNFKQTNPRR